MPLIVPSSAPAATSLGQWLSRYTRDTPSRKAPPYASAPMSVACRGQCRPASTVNEEAKANEPVEWPEGNELNGSRWGKPRPSAKSYALSEFTA